MKIQYLARVFLILSFLGGCKTMVFKAPVEALDGSGHISGQYQVSKQDTLYAIAWQLEMDVSCLIKANKLKNQQIKTNQQLLIPSHSQCRNMTKSSVYDHHHISVWQSKVHKRYRKLWQMPFKGQLIESYLLKRRQKGLLIRLKAKEAIHAPADGKIVYAGQGIRGYGGPVYLIRHHASIISAIAGPQHLLKHVGQFVKKGQIIAYVDSQRPRANLHFEIRVHGKAVNPMLFVRRHVG